MLGKFIFLGLFFANFSLAFTQEDSVFYKSMYGGGNLVIPKNETWELDKVFVNNGGTYSIQVSNSNIEQKVYNFGDTLKAPYYIAEMEIFDNRDMVQYKFYFKLLKD